VRVRQLGDEAEQAALSGWCSDVKSIGAAAIAHAWSMAAARTSGASVGRSRTASAQPLDHVLLGRRSRSARSP
jgi:hypothetical protein